MTEGVVASKKKKTFSVSVKIKVQVQTSHCQTKVMHGSFILIKNLKAMTDPHLIEISTSSLNCWNTLWKKNKEKMQRSWRMSNDTPSIWVARLPYSSMLVHLDNIVDRNTSILVRHIRHLSKICRPLNSFTYLNLSDSIIYKKVILNIMTGVHLCQLRYTYVFFIQTATFF